jgi:hypothetical protein
LAIIAVSSDGFHVPARRLNPMRSAELSRGGPHQARRAPIFDSKAVFPTCSSFLEQELRRSQTSRKSSDITLRRLILEGRSHAIKWI